MLRIYAHIIFCVKSGVLIIIKDSIVDWLVGVRLWNANYISLKKTIRASVQDRERERERGD